MTRIIYIEADGTEHAADVANGLSVMEGAVKNGIPGIAADCGGSCACATCHVYIAPSWQDVIGSRTEDEDATIELAWDRRENSRLSCQIKVSNELDGLIVHMPTRQH